MSLGFLEYIANSLITVIRKILDGILQILSKLWIYFVKSLCPLLKPSKCISKQILCIEFIYKLCSLRSKCFLDACIEITILSLPLRWRESEESLRNNGLDGINDSGIFTRRCIILHHLLKLSDFSHHTLCRICYTGTRCTYDIYCAIWAKLIHIFGYHIIKWTPKLVLHRLYDNRKFLLKVLHLLGKALSKTVRILLYHLICRLGDLTVLYETVHGKFDILTLLLLQEYSELCEYILDILLGIALLERRSEQSLICLGKQIILTHILYLFDRNMVVSLAYYLVIAVWLLDILVTVLHLPVRDGISLILKKYIPEKLPVVLHVIVANELVAG